MKYIIGNYQFNLTFDNFPFQLTSMTYQGYETIYERDQVWKWSFPILFPMCDYVSTSKYKHNEKLYDLRFHGFSRNEKWDTVSFDAGHILVKQVHIADEEYPFSCEIFQKYTILDDTVTLEFTIKNTSDETMYYTSGFHPGFKLWGSDVIKTSSDTHFFTKESFLENKLKQVDEIKSPIIQEAFDFQTSYDTLVSNKRPNLHYSLINDLYKIDFNSNYSHLWLWKHSNDANYICLEATDTVPHMTDKIIEISKRESINSLKPGDSIIKKLSMIFTKI